MGRVDLRRWSTVGVAVAWALGLSAWWWVSMVTHRDLSGVNTAWDAPGVVDHLGLLSSGERGWRGATGPLVAGAVALGIIVGSPFQRRHLLVLGLMPVAALGALHGTHALLGMDDPIGMQLVNRTLIYVALLATAITGLVIDAIAHRASRIAGRITRWIVARITGRFAGPLAWQLPRRLARRVPAGRDLAWVPVAVLTAVVLTGQAPPSEYHQRPDPALEETARFLADAVPPGGRFAFAPVRMFGSGVPEPGRWLAWASGRPGLEPFCPECAAGSSAAFAVFETPTSATIDEWIDRVRALGVTHVVTEDPTMAGALGSTGQVEFVDAFDHISTWAIRESPGRPVGSVVPAPQARTLVTEPERIVVETDSPQPIDDLPLALGYSPGWTARIDGRPIDLGRGFDDTLTLDLPAGRHRIELRFTEPATGPAGRLITLATVVAMLATRLRRRRHRRRSDRDDDRDPSDAPSVDTATEPTAGRPTPEMAVAAHTRMRG